MTGPAAVEEEPTRYLSARAGAVAGVRLMIVRHGVVAALSAVGTTYLIRDLGPAAWGGFALSYMLLVGGDAVLSRGVVASLLRRRAPADPATVASAARLVLYAGVGLAAVLLALAAALPRWYDPPGLGLLLAASAFCVLTYAARSLPLTLLERDLRYRPVALSEIGDMVAFYLVAVPGVALGAGIEAVALATAVRGLVALLVVRSSVRAPWIGSSVRPAVRTVLPFGVPLCALIIISAFDGLVPVAAIPDAEQEIGYIFVAATILGYATSLVTAIGRVAIPSLGQLEPDDFARAGSRSIGVTSFVTLSCLVPVAGLAGLWVVPLLGPEWGDGVDTMVLIAAGLIPAAAIGVLTAALTAVGRTGTLLWTQVAAIAVYGVGSVALVLAMGPLGCAVAYVLSRWTYVGLMIAAGRQVGIVLGRDTFVPLALAAAILGVLTAATDAPAPVLVGIVLAASMVWLLACRAPAGLAVRAVRGRLGSA